MGIRALKVNQKILALGRLKTGQMNKTEQAYADYLERQKQAGEILWYKFEGIDILPPLSQRL